MKKTLLDAFKLGKRSLNGPNGEHNLDAFSLGNYALDGPGGERNLEAFSLDNYSLMKHNLEVKE